MKNKYGIQVKPRFGPVRPVNRVVSHTEFVQAAQRVISMHAKVIEALASR